MPVIQGPHAVCPTGEFAGWGLARFSAGAKNVTEPHFHDCDEFVFMLEGRMVMRSEGIDYTLEPGDVLVTRMGDEHEILAVLQDCSFFWCETELHGEKRPGHLHRPPAGAEP